MENLNELKPVGKLSPFAHFCCTIGNLPASYMISLTYEEQLLWLCNYLEKTVIPAVNTNAEAVAELQELYVVLKNYVDNYFDNLDVQEEINNKLDEMAEDGTLLNILSNYSNLIKIHSTVQDMIQDTTLINNQKILCFGLLNINDGLGGTFIINETTGIKLNNGLYAKLINNYQNNFYDEISCEIKRYYDTDVYIAIVPKFDKNNNIIKLYPAKQDYGGQSPNKYAQDNNTSLTINGVITIFNKNNNKDNLGVPTIISNGEIINNNDLFGNQNVGNSYLYIGITENREIKEFQVNTTSNEQLLNSGCNQVFDVYWKLIENYRPLSMENVDIADKTIINTSQPRMSLGELQNGDIIIIACDGRTSINKGLTSEELQNIFVEYGAKNAWNMDGGGSTSLNIKTEKINRNIDDNGTEDRAIAYTLNVKRDIINKNIADSYSQSSKIKQNIISQILPLINSLNIQNLNNNDCNNMIGKIIVGYGNRITNTPYNDIVDSNGYFINIPHYDIKQNFNNLYNTQFFINRQTNIIYTRNQVNGEFNSWEQIKISDYIYSSLSANITIPNNEYNIISFNNIISNSLNIIPNENNSIFRYNGNRNRKYKITASIDYNCKNEKSTAYLSLFINNGANILSVTSLNNEERKTLSNTIVVSLNPNAEISLKIQGKPNDMYYRSNLLIEEI